MAKVIPNVKTFYKGQVIYKEGQPGSTAYMIKSGQVATYRSSGNKKLPVGRYKEGEIFGEMGVFAGEKRTVTAEAAEFCELMVLTNQFVNNLLEQCPKTIQFLTKLLIHRLKAATGQGGDTAHKGTFISVCRILELAHQNHVNTPAPEARKNPNHKMGVDLADVSKQVKDILLVSQAEIDRVVEQLHALKIIEVNVVGKKRSKAFQQRFIRINDPANFMQVAANLHRELKTTDAGADLEYVDIFDLAEELDADPEVLYRKIGNKEFPETLVFFNKKLTLGWAAQQEEGFFKKVKKRKKKPDELEGVDDIVFVDNATLKDVFAKLGYYKLGVLYQVADNDAKKKILSNLARKIAKVVQEEAEARQFVDEAEAEDVQDELVELIKTAKGVQGA